MPARIVPRYQRLALSGDYADVWVDARANPPMSIFDDFESRELKRIRPALASIIKASNLEAEDGSPIDLSNVAGWEAVPVDFLYAVADVLLEVLSNPKPAATPSSSAPTSASAAPLPAATP